MVITFLSRSKHLLISGLQSPSAVILEPKTIKLAIVSPSKGLPIYLSSLNNSNNLLYIILNFLCIQLKIFPVMKSLFSLPISLTFSCLPVLTGTPSKCWVEMPKAEILAYFPVSKGMLLLFLVYLLIDIFRGLESSHTSPEVLEYIFLNLK